MKWLTSAAEGTHLAITAGLHVEAMAERSSFWGELMTTATLAANDSLVVSRGVVYPPAMTYYSAQNHSQLHAIRLLLAPRRRCGFYYTTWL